MQEPVDLTAKLVILPIELFVLLNKSDHPFQISLNVLKERDNLNQPLDHF
jgi:hypothetical protein